MPSLIYGKRQFGFFSLLFVLFIGAFLPVSAVGSSGGEDLRQKVMEDGLLRSLVAIRQLIPDGVNPDCFISRVCMPEGHPDAVWSDRIESYLRSAGVRTIYDVRNLVGGADIEAFAKQIGTTGFVMTLFSPQYKGNYGSRTWIHREAELIKERFLREGGGFFIPVLLVDRFENSVPPECLSADILHYPLTSGAAGEYKTDWGECFEFIFRAFKEKIYRNLFGIGMVKEGSFDEIKRKYDIRKSRVPAELFPRNLQSPTGFFPQSLIAHNAFLDRADETGLSYLDRIFDELFISEDTVSGFSTTTLCASGMGGVGKTTLATEYAHKYGSFYSLVYWLNGSSKNELLRSYISLLELLGIPTPDRGGYEEDRYYAEVIRLINERVPRKSLLVIDNIEEPALVDYVRPGSHILYTSRKNDWLRRIDVNVLKRDESVKLLLQLTGLDPSLSPQAETLADELGDLPLALAQAAAYIKQQPLSSFAEYLDHYRVSQADLLARSQIQASLNAREAIVMTTWNTTMQRLSPEAQQLMHYLAYLGSNEIPGRLFQQEADYEALLGNLASYHMITNQGAYLSLHTLVQRVERLNQEKTPPEENRTLEELCSIFLRTFDSINLEVGDGDRAFAFSKLALELNRHIDKAFGYWDDPLKKAVRERDAYVSVSGKLKGLSRIYELFAQDTYVEAQGRSELEEKKYIQLMTKLTDGQYAASRQTSIQFFPEIMEHGTLLDRLEIIKAVSMLAPGEKDNICGSARRLFLPHMSGQEHAEIILAVNNLSLPREGRGAFTHDQREALIGEILLLLTRSTEGWARGCSLEAFATLSSERRGSMVALFNPLLNSPTGSVTDTELVPIVIGLAGLSLDEITAFVTNLRPVLLRNLGSYDFEKTRKSVSSLPPFLKVLVEEKANKIFDILAGADNPGEHRANVLRILIGGHYSAELVQTEHPLFVADMSEWDRLWIHQTLSEIPDQNTQIIEATLGLSSAREQGSERVLLVQSLLRISPELRGEIGSIEERLTCFRTMTEKNRAKVIRSLAPASSSEQMNGIVYLTEYLTKGRVRSQDNCAQIFKAVANQYFLY